MEAICSSFITIVKRDTNSTSSPSPSIPCELEPNPNRQDSSVSANMWENPEKIAFTAILFEMTGVISFPMSSFEITFLWLLRKQKRVPLFLYKAVKFAVHEISLISWSVKAKDGSRTSLLSAF